MNATFRLCLVCGFGAVVAVSHAQTSQTSASVASDYQVVDRGLHHKVWQRVTFETNDFGGIVRVIAHTNAYTQLANGVSFRNPVTDQLEIGVGHIQLHKLALKRLPDRLYENPILTPLRLPPLGAMVAVHR